MRPLQGGGYSSCHHAQIFERSRDHAVIIMSGTYPTITPYLETSESCFRTQYSHTSNRKTFDRAVVLMCFCLLAFFLDHPVTPIFSRHRTSLRYKSITPSRPIFFAITPSRQRNSEITPSRHILGALIVQ